MYIYIYICMHNYDNCGRRGEGTGSDVNARELHLTKKIPCLACIPTSMSGLL